MYPDPSDASLLQARAWFQANHPDDVTVVSVYKNFKINETTWTTAFKDNGPFPAPFVPNIITARKLFQRFYSNICKILNVTIRADERNMTLWYIETKPLSPSCFTGVSRIFHRRTVVQPELTQPTTTSIIPSSVSVLTPEQSSSSSVSSADSALTVLIKRGQDKILVSPKSVTPTDAPLRLIQNGRNVTRKYVNRNSLCRKVFEKLQEHLHEDAITIRKIFAKTSIKFVPASESIDKSCQTSSEPQLKDTTQLSDTKCSIPYDYTINRQIYLKSKLSDFNTFRNVRRYILTKFGILGHGTLPLKDTVIELANMLQYQGLPLDRSLENLYFEYCKERNIISDPRAELQEYMQLLKLRPVQVR